MNGPNVFMYAPSELSQDAFLCWLAEWANPTFSALSPSMHETGCRFIRKCFEFHNIDVQTIDKVLVKQQIDKIDVLLIVNDQYAIIIEDKTFTSHHDDQLKRYIDAIHTRYPSLTIIPVYLKTGNESDLSEIVRNGYQIFKRSELLHLLTTAIESGCNNELLVMYHNHLDQLDREYNAYKVTPSSRWSGHSWAGFFTALKEQLGDGNWDYVANPSGGFMGFWWHFRPATGCSLYLQLEQNKLCFKIAVEDKKRQSELRDFWHKKLARTSNSHQVEILKPDRFGKGNWMTIGVLKKNYITIGPEGLDMVATLLVLRNMERILDDTLALEV